MTAAAKRSALRRAQILAAAKHCFARVGFHSTSMARIAARAKMSVGQIYRHFPSKESLIEGIVQADVERQLAEIDFGPGNKVGEVLAGANAAKRLPGGKPDPMYLALMLEIVAEAARNPRIREIVMNSQRRGHEALKRRIEQAQPGIWPAGELDVRLRLVSALGNGVVTQSFLDRRAPVRTLMQRVDALTRQLLTYEADR